MDFVLCLMGLNAAQAYSAFNTAAYHIFRRRAPGLVQRTILAQLTKTELLDRNLAAVATSATLDAALKTELA